MEHVQYGLVGKRLGHSFSKTWFSRKFQELGLQAEYLNFEIPDIGHFPELLTENPLLRGLNVTIPYKQAVIPWLHSLDETAQAAGAVNVIRIRGGRLEGFNTDVVGFRDSLAEWYGAGPGGEALILGTGGASRAVQYVLQHYFAFDQITCVSRTPAPQASLPCISYSSLRSRPLSQYRLIVNTTPLGMHPDTASLPDLDYAQLAPGQFLFDLVYNPEETAFLREGRAMGCAVRNGLDMLIRQAEAAWEIWNEAEPEFIP